MPYRPQFAYPPTPPGFTDEDFVYVFNEEFVSALGTILSPGQTSLGILLQLQSDGVEFIIREIEIGSPQAALGVRFRDAFDNYMSDSGPEDFLPSWAFASSEPNGGQVQEPEIVCPAGSVLLLDIANVS